VVPRIGVFVGSRRLEGGIDERRDRHKVTTGLWMRTFLNAWMACSGEKEEGEFRCKTGKTRLRKTKQK
jgi:hypothetical protein